MAERPTNHPSSNTRAERLAEQMQELLIDLEEVSRQLQYELEHRQNADMNLSPATTGDDLGHENGLVEYLDQARISWSNVRAFFGEAFGELRTGSSSWDTSRDQTSARKERP